MRGRWGQPTVHSWMVVLGLRSSEASKMVWVVVASLLQYAEDAAPKYSGKGRPRGGKAGHTYSRHGLTILPWSAMETKAI